MRLLPPKTRRFEHSDPRWRRRATLEYDHFLVESDTKDSDDMQRSRFNEEQIVAVLKEQEGEISTAEACRRDGISSATFYKWKSKFGRLEVFEARRLRSLKEETPG